MRWVSKAVDWFGRKSAHFDLTLYTLFEFDFMHYWCTLDILPVNQKADLFIETLYLNIAKLACDYDIKNKYFSFHTVVIMCTFLTCPLQIVETLFKLEVTFSKCIQAGNEVVCQGQY